jgi:hypothetical protein
MGVHMSQFSPRVSNCKCSTVTGQGCQEEKDFGGGRRFGSCRSKAGGLSCGRAQTQGAVCDCTVGIYRA